MSYKEEKTETQRQTLRGQVQAKTEAETGVTHLQAKERQGCWPPPEARRDEKDPLPEVSESAWPCQHVDG